MTARPIKKGLPYFPVDTEWERNLKLFQAKFGVSGVGTWTLLLKWIYNEGYYIGWDNETRLLFADENHVDEKELTKMIAFAIEKELFDKNIFKKYKILTSRGIQRRYLNGCLKRTEVHFSKKLLLIEPIIPNWSQTQVIYNKNESFQVSETPHKDSKTPHKKSETPKKDTCGTQSRGSRGSRGSKVEEVKESREKIPETPPSASPRASPSAPPPEFSSQNKPPGEEDRPGKSRDRQIRELATRLRVEDPVEYEKLVDKHPWLQESRGECDRRDE